MEVVIYVATFLAGVVFGSFFTLAVYRIPRKENIVYGRSHCTSCNHRLVFWDLIPILSYLLLRGRCRYCGEKIRIRYLLLEVFSGIVFLSIALTHGVTNWIDLIWIYLFVAGLFISAGIDREHFKVPNGLCLYEFLVAIGYCVYGYFVHEALINHIIGFTLIPLAILVLNKLFSLLYQKEKRKLVGIGDIMILSCIGLMLGYQMQVIIVIASLCIAFVGWLIHRYHEIPWVYYLTIATCLALIAKPFMTELLEFM